MSIRPTRRICVTMLALALVLGTSSASAHPPRTPAPSALVLACRIEGGGYAITDPTGRVLENGDGVPFAPPPRATLQITDTPARVQVIEGTLPHRGCSTGPVLQSAAPTGNAPIDVTWCDATYQIIPTGKRAYTIRSKISAVMAGGDHAGDTMNSFMVGTCTARDSTRHDEPRRANSPPHQSTDRLHPVTPRKRPR